VGSSVPTAVPIPAKESHALRRRLHPSADPPGDGLEGRQLVGRFPASTEVLHRPVDLVAHAQLLAAVGNRPPDAR